MGDRPRNETEHDEARISALCRAYLGALLAADEVAAEIIIREAMEAELPASVIDDEIIAPALWFVGELWGRGEITVADEHLATEISLRVLALRREAQRVARGRLLHKVMLATPAGELHVVALRMIGDRLRDAGYKVLMLGADVPPADLAAAARRYQPDVVCLSATLPRQEDQVLIAIHEVQQQCPAASFVVGGRGLTSRLRSRPGIAIGARVSEAVEAVDALVKRADMN